MATGASLFSLFLLAAALLGPPSVTGRPLAAADDHLISDGVDRGFHPRTFLGLGSRSEEVGESGSCDATYGFLPCTTNWAGNVFLIITYGYLMFLAATYLSAGSELLLAILGPGIIGGLFLPILGALPDAMLILVSGISGSTESAQSQVSVGMGLLAGSTVMLLTIVWGSCVVVGKCDIQDSMAVDSKDTQRFSITGSGISTDIWTSYAAGIMALSVIPFIIVQAPQLFNSTSLRHLAILIALIVSVLLLITYCLYQVFQPWIQSRRIAYVKHKHFILAVLKHLKRRALGRLLTDDGQPNKEIIGKLFDQLDEDSDEKLSRPELRAFVLGAQFEEIDLDEDEAVDNVLKEFDTSHNDYVEKSEFLDGISRWLSLAKGSKGSTRDPGPHTVKLLDDFHIHTKREHDLMVSQSDETDGGVEDPKLNSLKAVLMLFLGAAVAAAFADPLVDAVDNFSSATGIPSFFISFIVLPFATNSSEAVSAIIFASRKSRRNASLTFSELYGAVTMNNVLCLAVFLALVYARGLTWDFSAEVLIILIVCIVMGAFGGFRTTFPLWTSFLAFALYPFSLALVYVLDYVFGWS